MPPLPAPRASSARCLNCHKAVHETIPGSGVWLHTGTGTLGCPRKAGQPTTTVRPDRARAAS